MDRTHGVSYAGILHAGLGVCLFAFGTLHGQVLFKQPQPGDIYREYSRIMDLGTNDWRVTDPNATHPNAAPYLNNPKLDISIDDLQGAVKAELLITMWHGHEGTHGKAVRFNNHAWIPIPDFTTANGIAQGTSGECYLAESNPVIDIPLADLVEGTNQFEGTNAGQTCGDFGWGQFGWYGVIVRIYYNSGKAHATGGIASPQSGGTFGENPTITASVSGADRVDFLAYYDGYDTDGDGVFQEYHHDFQIPSGDGSMEIHNHVGTATGPFSVQWNTQWIPDQQPGSVKLLARIRNNNGVWFVSNEVTNLTFQRTRSVRLYKPQNVPENFTVRHDLENASSNFTIPAGDDLSKADGALLLIRTWNGVNGDAPPPNDTYFLKVNNWTAPTFGADHYYSFDALDLPTSSLKNGSNTVSAFGNSTGHGVEYLWPGPAVIVSYSAPVPIQLSSFTAVILNQNTVQLTWTTLSETNNYGFEVQKSNNGTSNYETLPSSFVSGHGTTLDPHQYTFTDVSASPGTWYYRLRQIDLNGTEHFTDGVLARTPTDVKGTAGTPTAYALLQNYPNPFNPSTVISYAVPQEGFVTIRLFTVSGQYVKTIVAERKTAGYYAVTLDASDLASGMYFYRMSSGDFVSTRKFVWLK